MKQEPILRRRKDFRLLWCGQAVSQFGSRGYGVAIMLWVLGSGHSPSTLGLVSSVTLATFTVAILPGGWLADRLDRRLIMCTADAASALATGSLAVAAATGLFQLAHVLTAVAVLGAGWAVRGTAEHTALPHVVSTEELPSAVALGEARGYATGVLGPPVAAATFGFGAWLPFLTDAVSYAVAGFCAALVRRPLRATAAERGQSPLAEPPLAAIREGLRFFWHHRFIRITALLSALTEFVVNGSGLVVVVVLVRAGVPAYLVGVTLAAAYAAGLTGTAILKSARRHISPHALLVLSPAIGAPAVGAIASGKPVVAGIAYAAVLLVRPAWPILVSTRWLDLVEDGMRGRVSATIDLVSAVPITFTPLIIGLLLAEFAAAPTALLLAGLLAAATVVTAANSAIRQGIRRPTTDVRSPLKLEK
ncbi:MFS transporter [Nocardia sp. NPDC051052]|uniref:MFS transporter n=1 Tax=Nocardia sp. NPDC051052 TaxID=3364322 RepID=UPI0037B6DFE1